MPETIQSLSSRVRPDRTILLFGAGSSIPSGAPTSQELNSFISARFGLPKAGFSLSEIANLAERKVGRKTLVAALREKFAGLKPTGGLLNIPLYN